MSSTKAIIFARVSTKTQDDVGYSLDSQLKLLRDYCRDKQLTVDKEFRIVETASKQQQRKEFQEMLNYLPKHRIYHLVAEKTDRLTRNLKDGGYIDEWLEGDEARVVHCVKEGLQLYRGAQSQAKFMWGINLIWAKQYTDKLREEAMKGWAEKLAQGWLPGVPPVGYITVTQYGKKIHIPNPLNHMLIEPVFKFALLPDSSVRVVREKMTSLGLTTRKGRPFAVSMVHDILTNPFYTGINRFDGKDYPGAQEPLISKELFDAVQEKLHGGRTGRTKKHNPLFKGMIRCAHCGAMITWQLQKNRWYGACQRTNEACKKRRLLRQDRLEQRIALALESIGDSSGRLYKKLEALLQITNHQSVGGHRSEVMVSLQNQIVRLKRMRETLYEDRLAGEISSDRYKAKADDLEQQVVAAQDRLSRVNDVQASLEPAIIKKDTDKPILALYEQVGTSQKRAVMALLFKKMIAANGDVDLELANPLQ